jgi:PPP family 3-phenylpropionic acid transporter
MNRLKNTGLFDKELVPFYIYYTVIFMGAATLMTFLNIYFKEGLGFSLTQIGRIASIGPIVSIVTQPWWGILSDRTNKKKVLMGLTAGAMVLLLLFPLHYTFIYIFIISALQTMFSSSITPLGDAIALQFLEKKKIKFNTIRMIGTISYALMAAVVGYFVGENLERIFYFNAFFMGIALVAIFWFPDLQRGIKAAKAKAPPIKESLRELFSSKMILCILATSLVFGLTMTFYHAYLGIWMRGDTIGATEVQVGQALFLSAASEIPILLFVNKLFGKRKPIHLLMIVGLCMAVRFGMMFLADVYGNLPLVFASQLLHGLTFMVHFYFTVVLLNDYAPVHIKSTVQTLNAVIRAIAAVIGAGIGGTLADPDTGIGIANVYLILAVFVFATCFIVPGIPAIIYRKKIREMKNIVN